jgi:hypothetical protein
MPEDPESDLSWMAEPVVENLGDALRDGLRPRGDVADGSGADLTDAWAHVDFLDQSLQSRNK